MSNIIDSLITDRTLEDVKKGSEKGFYNHADLNRVETAVEAAARLLTQYGYPTSLSVKKTWSGEDFPTETEMDRYLGNIKKCLSQYCKQAATPNPPVSMSGLDYAGANTIEQILKDIDLLLPQMADIMRPSGTFYAGE